MRTDAIGQELKVNECVLAISGSSTIGGNIALITKINAKTVQLNGSYNLADDRMVIVTENLCIMGKIQRVEALRKKYESVVDATDPTTIVKALPVRYILLKSPDGAQHLIRFEGLTRDQAVSVINSVPEVKQLYNGHNCRVLTKRNYAWISGIGYGPTISFLDSWHFDKNSMFSLRNLPDNIAKYAAIAQPYASIPLEDHQPDQLSVPRK